MLLNTFVLTILNFLGSLDIELSELKSLGVIFGAQCYHILIIALLFCFSQEALCAFCNCGSDMAQILGQINQYYPSPNFDPVKFEERAEAGGPSAEKYNDSSKDSLDIAKQSDFLLRPDARSVGRPPGKRKRRGRQQGVRHHMLSVDMCTFGTPSRPDISDVFDTDGCIWAHHCCAAWSAGVCQTDSYDLENVDKAAYKAIGEVVIITKVFCCFLKSFPSID